MPVRTLIYIANAKLPTEKAHGLQIMSMCEAFASEGMSVTLVIPRRNRGLHQDPFVYYGIKKNFAIRSFDIPNFIGLGVGGFWINQILFSVRILFCRFGKRSENVIFTRDEVSGLLMRVRGYRVFYDMHGFPEFKRWFWKMSMRMMDGIVTTNRWKIEQCATQFQISREKLMVAPNGFDPGLFSVKESKANLRSELGLAGEHIVMYTGHLYDWKGAHILAEAASHLPDTTVVFVGGTDKDRSAFVERFGHIDNIMFVPHQPHQQIPKYLKAADVLVLPNSAHSDQPRYTVYSQFDTSPIKMFEYMASGTPIVASNLPSIGEILNQKNAVLVMPDDAQKLADGIRAVLNDIPAALMRATRAEDEVREYTLKRRAQKILGFINRMMVSV